MQDLYPTVILAHVSCGILATDLDPAGIKFRLEQSCRDVTIQNIDRVLAVDLRKLKIVVMIGKDHAELLCLLAEDARAVDDLLETGVAGAVFLRKVRDNDELAADRRIGLEQSGIVDHIRKRNVCGDRHKIILFAIPANGLGIQSEQTGKLHAVVPEVLDLLQRTLEITFHVVADGI